TADWVAQRYGLSREEATATLERLTERGLVRRGEFLAGAPGPQYVHIAVLEEVQRRQVHARRLPRPVATAEQFSAMLLRRHHLHPEHRLAGPTGVLAAVELLQGEDFPARVWEQDLLVPRVEDYQREWLDRLGLAGEIVWTVFELRETASARPGRVGLALRENAGWLPPRPGRPAGPAVGSPARHRPLERAGGGGRTLARGARGGARPPAAGALRRALARAGPGRLVDAASHVIEDGVRRRGRARLLRRGSLR